MSSNHKAPLAAFVVVALACVVVLATNSMRSYARDAWRQFAAPVVTGLTLVPHVGGSATSPAHTADATATTPDVTTGTHTAVAAVPAVALITTQPATPHGHRHHPAKTTPASDTTPVPPTPVAPPPTPVTPPPAPATPAWSHGPWHGTHPAGPAAAHQPTRPASTHPTADRGHHVGQSKQPAGLDRGPGHRGWSSTAPARGSHGHQSTKASYAADGSQSPSRGQGHAWGHGQSFGPRGH